MTDTETAQRERHAHHEPGSRIGEFTLQQFVVAQCESSKNSNNLDISTLTDLLLETEQASWRVRTNRPEALQPLPFRDVVDSVLYHSQQRTQLILPQVVIMPIAP
jgi:hypothetical protein